MTDNAAARAFAAQLPRLARKTAAAEDSWPATSRRALRPGAAAHIVNGRTVNVATRLQQPDPQNPGQFIPPD